MLRDRPDRAREDDHAEGRADEAVGEDDDQHRRVALEVGERQADAGERLVEEPEIGRRHDPAPQQRIDHRRAHARQEPDRPEEAAGPVRQRRREQREQETVADVEDREGEDDVDQRRRHDGRQPAVAAEHALDILGGEAGHLEVAAHVAEGDADVDNAPAGRRTGTAAGSPGPGRGPGREMSSAALRRSAMADGDSGRRGRPGSSGSAQLLDDLHAALELVGHLVLEELDGLAGVRRPVSTPCSALNRMPL